MVACDAGRAARRVELEYPCGACFDPLDALSEIGNASLFEAAMLVTEADSVTHSSLSRSGVP